LRKITGNKHRRAKQAASEVMGAILLMGATLAVGFAVWGYARGASSTAEKNFANEINSNINCLNLNFVIVNANFNSTLAYDKLVTIWFYSTTTSSMNITSITVSNSTTGGTWTYAYTYAISKTNTTGTLNPSTVKSVTINVQTQFSPNKLYSFQAEAKNAPMGCSIYSTSYNQITPNTSPV
jgi:hypothetical protein